MYASSAHSSRPYRLPSPTQPAPSCTLHLTLTTYSTFTLFRYWQTYLPYLVPKLQTFARWLIAPTSCFANTRTPLAPGPALVLPHLDTRYLFHPTIFIARGGRTHSTIDATQKDWNFTPHFAWDIKSPEGACSRPDRDVGSESIDSTK